MKRIDSIVITGLGIEIPGIDGLPAFLRCLDAPLQPADFDPVARLGRKGLRYKDLATKLALCAGKAALLDAGLPIMPDEQLDPAQFGVVASSNLGNIDTVCQVVDSIRAGSVEDTSPMDLPNASSNIVASSIAIWFGLKGPNLMLCNGATSGTDALFLAANLIRAERADRVLVVGVEVANAIVLQLMRESVMDRQQAAAAVRLCSGAGAVILESADAAARRAARIYAHLAGYGHAADCLPSIRAATGGGTLAPDLWVTPCGAYASTAQAIETVRRSWGDAAPAMLDLYPALGDAYGAVGVLQCIAACLWFKTYADGRACAVATSGGCWGDGVASVSLKTPAAIQATAGDPDARRKKPAVCSFERVLPETTLRTYEVRSAPTTGPTVAFIHGMEGRWDSWAAVWEHLHPQFGCYSLELPWSGQQDYAWSLVRQADAYIQMGLELIPTDVDLLVAHSFGANAVLEYVTQHALGSLKALVLIAPFFKAQRALFDWHTLTYYVERFQALLEDGVRVRQPDHRAPYPPDVLAALGEKVRDRIGPYGWLQFFTLFARTPDLNLQAVQIPCLVLGGVNDFASLPQDCEALARHLPYARVEILPECGHFSMIERPQLVAQAINQFLGTASGLLA